MTTLNDTVTSRPLVDVDLGELAAVTAELEHQPASAAIKWAYERYGSGLVLAASFQDCVLIDIAVKAAPRIEVVFLDTQYHFAETLWYVDRVRELYDLNLTVMEPLVAAGRPLADRHRRVLRDAQGRTARPRAARQAGVDERRPPRRGAVSHQHADRAPRRRPRDREGQPARGLVATTTSPTYKQDHDLPEHPLVAQGYPSIGCWPCTRAVAPGEDPRSGRWSATGKTECGLHGWPQP